MDNQEKLNAVHDYLKDEFPGSEIEVRFEPCEKVHVFQILQQGKSHRAIVTEAFLNVREAPQVQATLKAFTLAEHLREMGTTPIVVTPNGLQLEGV
jgi:hypothetical protein